MTAEFDGIVVKIPNGYVMTEDGTFVNGHGVEYQLTAYGRGESETVCLETVYSKHARTIELERS